MEKSSIKLPNIETRHPTREQTAQDIIDYLAFDRSTDDIKFIEDDPIKRHF